ncbi:hypothetical protein PC9H_006224 [Pleurotus ostreatus]|uniref:Uncharacterized protein n=1 Tax=Pleurotus ostreatus TaxID=5322 RepID=A0A8H7DSP1_PLEOS|nr:uncharacterized protein PC9H_006224 [Pleurotus ostreatus]KAF7430516.1 hypothetical protein PC9H_006224 [Pleurotus ostreatus]
MDDFIANAVSLSLSFEINYSGNKCDTIVNYINTALVNHMEIHRLSASTSPILTSSPTRPGPNPNPTPNKPYWHFLNAYKKPRSHLGPILRQTIPASCQINTTIANLQKHCNKWSMYTPVGASDSIPVVFIAPIDHVIVGPIPDFPVPGIIHACLAVRLWSGFMTPRLNERHLGAFGCYEDRCVLEEPEPEDSLDDIRDLQLPPLQLASPHSPPPLLFSDNTSNPSPVTLNEQFPLGFPPIKYEDVYPYGVQWREEISSMTNSNAEDDETIRIRSSDAASAAEAFFLKLLSLLGGDSTPPPAEVELENVSLDNLPNYPYDVWIGAGVGAGPMKSFWQALLQYMINENRQHWYENQEGFYSIISDELVEPEPSDLAMFATYGLVIRVHFPFIHALAPSTFTRLDTWPSLTHHSRSVTFTEGDITLGTDPFNLIIEFLPESAPPMASLIYRWSGFSVTSQGLKIAARIIFGSFAVMATTKPQIYTHVLQGLDGSHALLRRLNWSSLTDTFHDAGTAEKIIAAIGMGRRVTSPDIVIDLLRPQPSNTVLGLSVDEEGWMAHLKRYLRGSGYPRADSIVVNEDKRTIDSRDNTLRSRLLLKCVTGSEYVDINRSAIHITFRSAFDDTNNISARLAALSGGSIHVCTSEIEILMNQAMTLRTGAPPLADLSITTEFDAWIHSLIDAPDTYNNA